MHWPAISVADNPRIVRRDFGSRASSYTDISLPSYRSFDILPTAMVASRTEDDMEMVGNPEGIKRKSMLEDMRSTLIEAGRALSANNSMELLMDDLNGLVVKITVLLSRSSEVLLSDGLLQEIEECRVEFNELQGTLALLRKLQKAAASVGESISISSSDEPSGSDVDWSY